MGRYRSNNLRLIRGKQADATIDAAAAETERALAGLDSKQSRFDDDVDSAFMSFWRWRAAHEQCPPWQVDSRARDEWLAENWWREPHWAGMVRNEAALNANRAYTLTGGRNSVTRARRVIHQHWVSPDIWGHRLGLTAASTSYHTQDLGAVIETARIAQGDGITGPLAGFLHVDPSLCRLTGKMRTPLRYKEQEWTHADYFRIASLVSTREAMLGLGLCSTSVVLDVLEILMAVYQYDQEKLGAKAPRGILFLQNVTQSQWETAMASREMELSQMERDHYDNVAVIAQMGQLPPDGKLMALSSLPDNFDKKTVVELSVYLMALVLGRDSAEYWPVSGGSFGRSAETTLQHRKATYKAGAEFLKAYQERLQDETFGLSRSVHFEFDERDDEGALLQAAVAQAWGTFAQQLYAPGGADMRPLFEREQVQSLLVEQGIIPPEYTDIEEDVQATDDTPVRMRRLREQALGMSRVRAFVESPIGRTEPIVRYEWPSQRETVLWQRGEEALQRHSFPVAQVVDVLFEGDDFTITQADVAEAIGDASADMQALLTAEEWEEADGQ